MDDAERAETLIRNLARRLERDWNGVSASILEGIDEMLTVTRLGLARRAAPKRASIWATAPECCALCKSGNAGSPVIVLLILILFAIAITDRSQSVAPRPHKRSQAEAHTPRPGLGQRLAPMCAQRIWLLASHHRRSQRARIDLVKPPGFHRHFGFHSRSCKTGPSGAGRPVRIDRGAGLAADLVRGWRRVPTIRPIENPAIRSRTEADARRG